MAWIACSPFVHGLYTFVRCLFSLCSALIWTQFYVILVGRLAFRINRNSKAPTEQRRERAVNIISNKSSTTRKNMPKSYNDETRAVVDSVSDLFQGRFIITQRPKKGDLTIMVATSNPTTPGSHASQQPLLIEPGDVVWSVFPAKDSGDRDISELRHYIEQVCQENGIITDDGEPFVNWPKHGGLTQAEHGVLIPRISSYSQWHPRHHGGKVPGNAQWAKTDCYLSWVSGRVAQRGGGAVAAKRF